MHISHPAPDVVLDLDARASDEVLYQPIVELVSGEVVGVRALPSGPPPQCTPVQVQASASDRATDLWLADSACRQVALWGKQGLELPLTVRLTPQQVQEPRLVEAVDQLLKLRMLDPAMLLLELPERALTSVVGAGSAVHDLAALGVSVGLADFGTGHSTAALLEEHPIAELTLAPALVHGLSVDRDVSAIVAGVASLAAALDSRCVAEGVHTVEQALALHPFASRAHGELFSPAVVASRLPATVDDAEARAQQVDGIALRTAQRTDGPRAHDHLPPEVTARMQQMYRDGASLQTIAAALNQSGTLHPKGKRWHSRSVADHLARHARPSSQMRKAGAS